MNQYEKYFEAILPEFLVLPPIPVNTDDVFDGLVLRRDVFDAVLAKVDSTSSPGFPFYNIGSTNASFKVPGYNQELLYASCVILAFHLWFSDTGSPDSIDMLNRLLFPANVFIKNEATSKSKIARLIYGTPLNLLIIMRIIFGAFLDSSIHTFEFSSHKVGMDMYTDEGIVKIINSYKNMVSACPNTQNVSSDVQGYEYACSIAMHFAWFDAYYVSSTKPFGIHVPHDLFYVNCLTNLSLFLSRPFVCFDDGILLVNEDYFVLSGLLITHRMNSDTRAGLSRMLTSCPSMTNGDDCNENIPLEWDSVRVRSEYNSLGFNITDVDFNPPGSFSFSSQIFYLSTLNRVPISLTKSIVNFAFCKTVEAREEIRWFVRPHPCYSELFELLDYLEQVYPLQGASDGIKQNE